MTRRIYRSAVDAVGERKASYEIGKQREYWNTLERGKGMESESRVYGQANRYFSYGHTLAGILRDKCQRSLD